MAHYLCVACGTQFGDRKDPPAACPICSDDRQFVPKAGQIWVDYDDFKSGHSIVWSEEAPGIQALTLAPDFGIAQRALLVSTGTGTVLWDCLSLIDDATIETIQANGGLSAIAISHPHFYGAMIEWSRAFGNVPIYLHEADAEWVQRPDPAIRFWSGEQIDLDGSLSLIRCGGHFPGGTVMHWPKGCDDHGVLFTGDTIQVAQDRAYVSFMYSYPNMIPLNAKAVRQIATSISSLEFEALYGAFPGRTIRHGARAAVDRSVERYLRAVGPTGI